MTEDSDPITERTKGWKQDRIFRYKPVIQKIKIGDREIEREVRFPRQGWKIHVSADERSAAKVFDIVKPILNEKNVNFKVVDSIEHLDYMNSGSQVGKFITIEPSSEAQAVEIAKKIDEALKDEGLTGPKVLEDEKFGKSNLVFYRFGELRNAQFYKGEEMREEHLGTIQRPDRNFEPDIRTEEDNIKYGNVRKEKYKPDWMNDPFKDTDTLQESPSVRKLSEINKRLEEKLNETGEEPGMSSKGKVISTPLEINKEDNMPEKIPAENPTAKQRRWWRASQSPRPMSKPGPDEINCPTCGSVIPKGSRCPYCDRKPGETAEEWAQRKGAAWKCPTCGALNSQDVDVCVYCGRKAGETAKEWAQRTGTRKEPPTVFPKGTGILSAVRGATGESREEKPSEESLARARMWDEEREKEKGERKELDERLEKEDAEEAERLRGLRARAEMMDKEREIEKKEEAENEKERVQNMFENARGRWAEKQKAVEAAKGWRGGPIPDGYTKCPRCFDVYPKSKTLCPSCHYPNQELHLTRTQTVCPYCHKITDINKPFCDNCGKPNEAYMKTESLQKSTSKRISGRLYEILLYEIAGIVVIFGLPFFGLPSLPLLGVVLMAIFPFYSFLPSEHEALASRGQGVTDLGTWAAGALLLKGIVKMTAFILTVMQFMIIPVSKLIPLGISFVYYFTLPVSYKVTQPSKMIEAWFRIGVGALIAFFIFMAFNGTPQAISLALMSVAFFCTSFPKHKEAPEEQGVVRIELLDKAGLKYLKGSLELPLKILFLILMWLALAFSGVFSGIPVGGGAALPTVSIFSSLSSLQIIFIAVWLLSVFSGWVVGSEGRPALGILMIGITLFVFTFTATGVMGQAVFGYWWPQVQSTGDAIFGPLGNMWSQVQNSMSDTFLLMTNPAAYYDKMTKQTQATSSSVTQGGTIKSIELTTTSLFTSVNGELEPRLDPLVGSFEIQNQGEFEANKIKLDLWATWTNPTAASATAPPVPTGALDTQRFSCSQTFDIATSTSPITPPTSPAGGGQIGTCNWLQTTYPSEIKVVNFVFYSNNQKPGAWDLGGVDNLADCAYNNTPDTGCTNPDSTYVHGGQTVKVNVNLTYDYNVNVSIPVEVINQDKYRSLLESGGITLQQLTSEYTGGPVKATLWSQKQPVRDSEEQSLFVASIVNEGGGILNQIYNFKVLIPKNLSDQGNVQIIAQTFESATNSYDGCGTIPTTGYLNPIDGSSVGFPNYWVINCINNVPMKSGEYKRVSFFITPNNVIDRKTSILVGLANYEYIKTGSTSITVANAPWH